MNKYLLNITIWWTLFSWTSITDYFVSLFESEKVVMIILGDVLNSAVTDSVRS